MTVLNSQNKLNTISLGERISFKEGSGIEKYLLEGWSGQELTHRWTIGECAKLQFCLGESNVNDVKLRVHCLGFMDGKNIDHQSVDVLVNNTKVANWILRLPTWHEVVVPSELLKNGDLMVSFLINTPSAPCDSSLSIDNRKLGLCALDFEVINAKVLNTVSPDSKANNTSKSKILRKKKRNKKR